GCPLLEDTRMGANRSRGGGDRDQRLRAEQAVRRRLCRASPRGQGAEGGRHLPGHRVREGRGRSLCAGLGKRDWTQRGAGKEARAGEYRPIWRRLAGAGEARRSRRSRLPDGRGRVCLVHFHSMSFIPNTDADRAAMLEAVGAGSVAELFHDVPAEHRFPRIDLPAPLSEQEVLRELNAMSLRNADCGAVPCFLGAGAYRHFIPSVVDSIISRSEFATAYTPYQPEISQGTLQAIFEYQSMIARLTGMEVSNASHYDGATAAAEAVIMALNVTQGQRRRVVLSAGVHPQYRAVVRTYTQGTRLDVTGDESDVTVEELAGICDS